MRNFLQRFMSVFFILFVMGSVAFAEIYEFSWSCDGDVQLGPHFKLHEFRCHDNSDEVLVDDNLIAILTDIREVFGPVIITSGYRNPEYNERIGGAQGSQHTYGRAADIQIRGVDLRDVANWCLDRGVPGIELNYDQHYLHIDVRPEGYWHVYRQYRTFHNCDSY